MRLISLLVLLAGMSGACGQDTLALTKKPNSEQVATANEVIRASQQAPTSLAYGGYAIVDIKLEGKLTSYIVPGSDDCIKTISLARGQGYAGWLVTKGESAHKWTEIAPIATHDRLIVTGSANGTTTLIWMTVQNNEAVVVAAFQFVVGKPKPVVPDEPDVPPSDPLGLKFKAAAKLDAAANKADKKWLAPLAGIYESASNFIPETVATVGQLDELLLAARKGAGIPEPEVQFLNLRRAIQQEIYASLGVDINSSNVVLTADTRRLAMLAFGKIAKAIEEVAK